VSPVRYELGFYIPEDAILHMPLFDFVSGRSVGIVRSRTKGHGVCLFFVSMSLDRLCGLVARVPGC
jgi:hypothetical protein